MDSSQCNSEITTPNLSSNGAAVAPAARFCQGNDGIVLDSMLLSRKEQERAEVTAFVNEHIWPYKKFLVMECELDFGGKLQRCLYYKHNLNREDCCHQRVEMWAVTGANLDCWRLTDGRILQPLPFMAVTVHS